MWGDTVNVSSRMESSAKANTILVSKIIYRTLSDKYHFSANGTVYIKGKMDSYCLLAPL